MGRGLDNKDIRGTILVLFKYLVSKRLNLKCFVMRRCICGHRQRVFVRGREEWTAKIPTEMHKISTETKKYIEKCLASILLIS